MPSGNQGKLRNVYTCTDDMTLQTPSLSNFRLFDLCDTFEDVALEPCFDPKADVADG